jgi:hypothetical protein
MSKAFVAGLIAGLVLLLIAGAAGMSQSDAQKDAEKREYQRELSDATRIDRGVLSETQRVHGALFSYAATRPNKIDSLVERFRDEGKIFEIVIVAPLVPKLPGDTATPEYYFSDLASKSQAVIQGKVTDKVSQVTQNGAFIFTDYSVLVTEVYKDNAAAPITKGASITVTRPGGKVLLDGVIAKASDKKFPPLPAGRQVILYLQFIPETGAYKATAPTGSFELSHNTLTPLTCLRFPSGVIDEGNSLLQVVRAVSNKY